MSTVNQQKIAYESLHQDLGSLEAAPPILDNGVDDVRTQIGDNIKEIFVEEQYGEQTWRPSQCIVDVYQNHKDAQINKLYYQICAKLGITIDKIRKLDDVKRTRLFNLISKLRQYQSGGNIKLFVEFINVNFNLSLYIDDAGEDFDKICRALDIPYEKPKLFITIEVNGIRRLVPYSSKMKIPKRAKIKGFVCRDKGFGFDHNMLNLFGSSSKTQSGHLSGGLGEGLDMIMLVAKREDAKIRLVSSYEDKSWIVDLNHKKGEGDNVEYEVREVRTKGRPSGSITIYELPDNGSTFVNDIKNELDPRIEKPHSELLLDHSDIVYHKRPNYSICYEKEQAGNLYVQGLWITKQRKVLFSYDFADKFAFEGRDRKAIKEKSLKEAVKNEIQQLNDIEQMKKIIKAESSFERRTLNESNLIFISRSKIQMWLKAFFEVFVPEGSRDKNIIIMQENVDSMKFADYGITHEDYCLKLNTVNLLLLRSFLKNTGKLKGFPFKFIELDNYIEQKRFSDEGENTYEENEYNEVLSECCAEVRHFLQQKDIPLRLHGSTKKRMLRCLDNITFKVLFNEKIEEPVVLPKFKGKVDKITGAEVKVTVKSGTSPENLKIYVIPEIIKTICNTFRHDQTTQFLIDTYGLLQCVEDVRKLLKPYTEGLKSVAKIPEAQENDNGYLHLFDHMDEVKDILRDLFEAYTPFDELEKGEKCFPDELDPQGDYIDPLNFATDLIIKKLYIRPELSAAIRNFLNSCSLANIHDDHLLFFTNDHNEKYELETINLNGIDDINIDNPLEALKLDIGEQDQDYYYKGFITLENGIKAPIKIYCLKGSLVVEINNQIVVFHQYVKHEINNEAVYAKLVNTLDDEMVLMLIGEGSKKVKNIQLKKVQHKRELYEYEDIAEEFVLPTSIEAGYAKQFHTPRLIIKDILQNHLDGCAEGTKPEMYAYVVDKSTWQIRKIDLSKEDAGDNEVVIAFDVHNEGEPFSPYYLQKLGGGSKNDLNKGRFGEGLKLISAAAKRMNLFLEFSSKGWRAIPGLEQEQVYVPELEAKQTKNRVIFTVRPDSEVEKSGTRFSLINNFNFKEGSLPVKQRTIVQKFLKHSASNGLADKEYTGNDLWHEFTELCKPHIKDDELRPPYEKFFCSEDDQLINEQGISILGVSQELQPTEIYERGQLLDVEIKGGKPLFVMDLQFPIVTNRERTDIASKRVDAALFNLLSVTKQPEIFKALFLHILNGNPLFQRQREVNVLCGTSPSLDAAASMVRAFHSNDVAGNNNVLSCSGLFEAGTSKTQNSPLSILDAIYSSESVIAGKDAANLNKKRYAIYTANCNQAHFKGRTVHLLAKLSNFLFEYVSTADKAIYSQKTELELSDDQKDKIENLREEVIKAINRVFGEPKTDTIAIRLSKLIEDPELHTRLSELIFLLKHHINAGGDTEGFIIYLKAITPQIYRALPNTIEYEEVLNQIAQILSLPFDELLEITEKDFFQDLLNKEDEKLLQDYIRMCRKHILRGKSEFLSLGGTKLTLIGRLLKFIYFAVQSRNDDFISALNKELDSRKHKMINIPEEEFSDNLAEIFNKMRVVIESESAFSVYGESDARIFGESWLLNGELLLQDMDYGNRIDLNQRLFKSPETQLMRTLMHELGHIPDYSAGGFGDGNYNDYTNAFQVVRLKLWDMLRRGLEAGPSEETKS
ncbi:hypothetical protein ACFLZH_04200 [Patescibacteria group bacterium]